MEPRTDRQRTGARLMLPSGALLALCFFLPVVQVCDRPHAPYQSPMVFPPYLFGLLCAAAAALLVAGRGVPALLRLSAWLVALGGGGALAASLGYQALEARRGEPRALLGLGACGALALACALLPAARPGRPPLWRLGRIAWAGGALSAFWCLFLLGVTVLRDVRYGLWLTLGASIGLLAAGLLLAGRPGAPGTAAPPPRAPGGPVDSA